MTDETDEPQGGSVPQAPRRPAATLEHTPTIAEHLHYAVEAMAVHMELSLAKAQVLALTNDDTETAERLAKIHKALLRVMEVTEAEARRHER